MRTGLVENLSPNGVHEQIVQDEFRRQRQLAQDGLHRRRHVLPCALTDLDVDVDRAVLPSGVQFVLQRQQDRGLAGLTGRVQDEVLLLTDEAAHLLRVKAFQRRDAVMDVRLHRSGGVEETHGWHYRTVLYLPCTPRGSKASRRPSPR